MSGGADDLSRDVAILAAVAALLFFFLGMACGTSKELGMLLLWGLAVISLVVAVIAGARVVLLDHFKPPR